MSVAERRNVRVSGNGEQVMMFAHGFGCDQQMWRLIAPEFEKNYRVVMFDYVGHGKSSVEDYDEVQYGTLAGFADDVLAICHELDLRDVIFVGHSVSAAIGMVAAIREPERFSKLVLLCPSPCYINDGDYVGGFTRENIDELLEFLDSNHRGWSSAMAPVIMGNPERPELGEELNESFCRTHPTVAKQFARVTFLSDTRSDLPLVVVPSLIIQCSTDMIAPQSVGEYVHKHLPGSTLVTLETNGHCPHLSASKETLAAITNYLATP